MKLLKTCRLILVALALWCLGATVQAQNNYFSIVAGIPHLPVFANTAAVPSPLPGAMVYSTADGTVMIYSGDVWDSFCTQQLALPTGAFAEFTVQGGIPYLPVKSTTAVTSTTGTAGTLYYPSDQAGVRLNNSANWFTPYTLAAAPVTTTVTQAGNIDGLPGGVAFPVMASDPAFVAADQGAVYINSTDFKLHVNNGTAWVAVDCGACQAIAGGATVNVDDPNMTNIVGGYSYFQKTGIAEATSAYRWKVATDASGTGALQDPGQTTTYAPGYSDDLNGKYLQFTVYPRATAGILGLAVSSPWTLISNCPPQATGALVESSEPVYSNPSTIAVSYTFFDKEANLEGTSVVTLYKATDALGSNKSLLGTGTNTFSYAYTYADADQGKYLYAEVTPKATKGFSTGSVATAGTLIWNCPPQAWGTVSGDFANMSSNTFADGGYAYYDKEGDPENTGALAYRWFLSTAANGAGTTTDLGTGTAYTYTYNDADDGLYLNLGVKVGASKGYSISDEAIVSAQLKNCPPQANAALLTPVDPLFANSTQLPISYSYFDKEGNTEGATVLNWYMADDAAGTTNKITLGTGTNASIYTYSYTDADNGKYLLADVTPMAASGFSTGSLITTPSVQIWNCPPQASGVIINGTLTVGQTLTGGYAYFDKEGNAEGASTYQWYRDNSGTPIAGATSATYTLAAADQGHTVAVGVTPKAATGYSAGSETISAFTTTIP